MRDWNPLLIWRIPTDDGLIYDRGQLQKCRTDLSGLYTLYISRHAAPKGRFARLRRGLLFSNFDRKEASIPPTVCVGCIRLYCACLFFALIRQGLRGGGGPQRLTRALGIETANPIMTFEQRSSFSPSIERAPHQTPTGIPEGR